MLVTRLNPLTGKTHTLDIPCTHAQYSAWQGGMLIQRAMPNVPVELREFLISGITPEEWKEMFGDNGDA